MLEKLIEEIQKGDTSSPVELAARLGTSTSMVEAMLDTLESQGYLKTLQSTCPTDSKCDSCPLSGLCTTHSVGNPRIRVLNK